MSDVASMLRRSVPFLIPGVFLGSVRPQWFPFLPLLLVVGTVATAVVWPRRRVVSYALMVSVFAVGVARSAWIESGWDRERLSVSVSGTATVVRNPENDDAGRKAVVRFDRCDDGTACPKELSLVTFSVRSDAAFGDVGRLSCLLEPPDPEWRMYFAKDGIGYRCRAVSWERTGNRYPVRRALFMFSSRFEEALSRALPQPESGLAAGLLLGGGRRLPEAVTTQFRDAGLSHIVAVSGYNISIVAEGFLLLGVGLALSRSRAAVFSLLSTAAFVLVSGAPSSAVRAFGMASTLVAAGWFGRRYASVRAILFVASVMLFLNPLLLRHDIGFLLSFAATAGIALCSPIVGRWTASVRTGGFLVETALLTIVANLFVLPVIFANFGTFSPVSFLANVALLPLVPYAMFFSALTAFAGMVVPSFGTILSFPAYALLRPIVLGAGLAASAARPTMIHLSFGLVVAAVWYVGLAIFLFRGRIMTFLARPAPVKADAVSSEVWDTGDDQRKPAS
ncbi:MAG: ComEC/Rec2 family competence protein [Candidatus Moranbacteria bacterium]|nr:ComEC/Rec2 family competence protein [Candidatus Moranbacteria bacterium]